MSPNPDSLGPPLDRADLGRDAEGPGDFRAPALRLVLKRVFARIDKDNVDLVAAGVAFWGLLALFPCLALLLSLYGLFADAASVGMHVDTLVLLPQEVRSIVLSQLEAITSAPTGALGISVVGASLVTLWSASRGTRALSRAISMAYIEDSRPDFVRGNLKALLFTIGGLGAAGAGLATVAGILGRISSYGYTGLSDQLAALLPFAGLALLYPLGIAMMYRYAPPRRPPRWRWVTPGALLATLGWVCASGLFTLFVTRVGRYQETYGSLSAVVVLMLWMWITALLIIVGAQFDAELEHQTSVDSTIGPDRPMGTRGAFVADNVAPPFLDETDR